MDKLGLIGVADLQDLHSISPEIMSLEYLMKEAALQPAQAANVIKVYNNSNCL